MAAMGPTVDNTANVAQATNSENESGSSSASEKNTCRQ